MNILWFLDKEFDVAHNVSARLATIKYLEKANDINIVTSFRKEKKYSYNIESKLIYLNRLCIPVVKTISLYYQHLKFLNKKIDLQKIDVILINSGNLWLLKNLIKIRKYYNFKLVLDIRSLPVESNYLKKEIKDYFFRKCLKTVASSFDGITYISDEMREYCITKHNLPEHKNAIWGSGVDVEMFKPLSLSSSGSKFRLIYHGVITRNRGIINVVRAIDKLKEYDIEFFLLGSGEGMSELKNLVIKLKLENKVNFHLPVQHMEVPKYINTMDAGILPFPAWPGWNTSSPIKLFEYLACGKPVIVTRIPAHIRILDGKDFAFWAKTSSPEGIANAILIAYKNKKHFRKLGKEAIDFVKMNYSWEKQISKLEIFIKNIQC